MSLISAKDSKQSGTTAYGHFWGKEALNSLQS